MLQKILLASLAVLVPAAVGVSGNLVAASLDQGGQGNEGGEVRSIVRPGEDDQWSIVTHQVMGIGSWREFSLVDGDGLWVIAVVNPDANGFGSVSSKLRRLGLEEGVVPSGARVTSRPENGGETITIANSFAQVSTWFGPQSFLDPGTVHGGLQAAPRAAEDAMLIWRETTEVMGITMTVERFREQDGYLVTDDWGGRRIEKYNESGLTSLEDRNGRVVWITRDLQGRLCEVILGDSNMLRYRYQGEGPAWRVKELIDLRDGQVLRRWERGAWSGVARPRMQVTLPGHGMVAEWDAVVAPRGTVVAGLGGRPYALIPFDGSQDPVRSLTLADVSAELSWDRIDYTDASITLHVVLDAGGLSGAAERNEVVVDLARQPPPTETLEHIEGTPGTNCCSFCCSGGGGGGGGGASGVPLSPTQVQQVNAAKNKAKNTMDNNPDCAALFNGLSRPDGGNTIDQTTYRGADPGDTRCSGNDAFTSVNSLTVYVCDGFSNLSSNGRAVRLIHEALHSAGMTEKPTYPNAERTSAEINAWVKSTCGL